MTAWSALKPNLKDSASAAAALSDLPAFDAQKFATAWAGVTLDETMTWLNGVRTYHDAPPSPVPPPVPVMTYYGAARLYNYGGPSASDTLILVVPSLINRADILDLLPDNSFMRRLARTHHAWLLDWGTPTAHENNFTLDDYMAHILLPALIQARATHKKIILCGYCMGGLLALAAATLRPALIDKLVLLATPWDFAAYPPSARMNMQQISQGLLPWLANGAMLTVDQIQTLFAQLQPFAVYDKFKKIGRDPAACTQTFVAVEDWLNDGIPLVSKVALTCLHDWFQHNSTAALDWRVLGQRIVPQNIMHPTLLIVPQKDNVVPAAVAAPLADLLPHAVLHTPAAGHIGMMLKDDIFQPLFAFCA